MFLAIKAVIHDQLSGAKFNEHGLIADWTKKKSDVIKSLQANEVFSHDDICKAVDAGIKDEARSIFHDLGQKLQLDQLTPTQWQFLAYGWSGHELREKELASKNIDLFKLKATTEFLLENIVDQVLGRKKKVPTHECTGTECLKCDTLS